MGTPVLVVPGYHGSGPTHWQSLWEASDPAFRRVYQRDWDHPVLSDWIESLHSHIAACDAAPVIVAHSLACALVVHWAAKRNLRVRAAMLVSPSDVDSPTHTPAEVRSFSPMPLASLSFPSTVVVSTNDARVSLERAAFFAKSWGSHVVVLTGAGHINEQSGLGEWPEGKSILQTLLHRT
ncbi:MAG: alpha/beta hydrolase [Proteobacteria bacterium]|nr:alpha/beta hydrolase [Pseudomonadota bacterium]